MIDFLKCDTVARKGNAGYFRSIRSLRSLCGFGLLIIVLTGCAGSHFARMQDIQHAVQVGDYQRADELLSQEQALAEGRDRLLYLLDKGLIAHLSGNYLESNRWFTQAAERMETLAPMSISGAISEWVINDTTQPYGGEDFERVMVHYYMALNYLMLGELQEALVECRRLNTLLREFNDKYEQKNVYKTDAFILYLSGLVYDAMGATNDAFIDYRHAYDIYMTDYHDYYGTPVPAQLRDQLLRTSSALGFADVFDAYQRDFRMTTWTTQQEYRHAARLVVIWDNGLIPYKREQTYREYLEFDDHNVEEGCYVKLAFPEFVYRIPTYAQASVVVNGRLYPLEFAEDLTHIAIKNLEDRRIRTITTAIARNALKCLAEYELQKRHEIWGILFGIFTELSEQADTRSWLLLPANIHITQMLLPPGVSDVEIAFSDASGSVVHYQRYEHIPLNTGRTTFLVCRSF